MFLPPLAEVNKHLKLKKRTSAKLKHGGLWARKAAVGGR